MNKMMIRGIILDQFILRAVLVWVGDDVEGLNKIEREKNKVTVYSYDENSNNSLSNNSVQYIHEDKNGILWLATNGGLNKFDPENRNLYCLYRR
jgi:ligand-binding sensor domain-containing protein